MAAGKTIDSLQYFIGSVDGCRGRAQAGVGYLTLTCLECETDKKVFTYLFRQDHPLSLSLMAPFHIEFSSFLFLYIFFHPPYF